MSLDLIPEDLINPSGSNGDVLTTVSGRTQWTASPSGTGSGSGNVHDRRWNVPITSTSVDEFNDDTQDPAWVRVDGTGAVAANATWTEGADVLSVKDVGGDSLNCFHALMRPVGTSLSPGDAFVTHVALLPSAFGTNLAIAGLALANGTTFGSGSQVVADVRSDGVSAAYASVDYRAMTGYNANPSNAVVGVAPLRGVYLRLVMTAVNTWRVDVSPDGVSWLTGASTYSLIMTPTHVGLVVSSWGTSTKSIASFEFLRRVSGVS